MPTTKNKLAKITHRDITKSILFGVIILLITTCTILVFAFYNEKSKNELDAAIDYPPVYVSLGAMQYNFYTVNNKVTKRADNSIEELRAFLIKESNNSRCGGGGSDGPGYMYVAAHSTDETQVLLSYGCEYPGPSIYAVKTDQGWKTISPTNHFDSLGIPDCDYLTTNNISPEIAPVCANKLGDKGSPVGDPKYLNR